MAAIVTGLIPILRTAVDSTTTYKARTLWFGFLCIRLVTLFVAELPWFKLDSDFSCNATSEVCTRDCYNEYFNRPAVVAWNFLFVLLLLSVLLMELFSSYLRSTFQKKAARGGGGVEMGPSGEQKGDAADRSGGMMIIDLHQQRSTLLFYLMSVVIRIVIEVWFVYILLFWNLAALDKEKFHCKKCHYTVACLVRAASEKRMSIYALVSISSLSILTNCLFCFYAIGHYLCNFCTQGS
ncbi:gap junction beta-4 protein [Chanos chanos]|uniref:Gap junction beta-4 protein n=1 Tax=Chanos chanos TaxID=29144 RepID=A0A6J2VGQ8_CHACN|nr:gap junction beta-4 protein-like [Chanos chanos]